MRNLIIFFLGIGVYLKSHAGCEKPTPGYDTTYCMAKLFVESDNELNDAYKNISGLLKPEQKKKLINAQRNWIKYRNERCSTDGTIDVGCNYEVNKKRTKYILDRITECKIGSCNDQLLSNENWEKQ
jgi:uncharacterized protein YecT (DUF1311 family)